MPAPTEWLLSLASMTASGRFGLVVEDVVGLLGLAALHRLAADDDAALGEVDLLADLGHHVPLVAVGADEAGVMNLVRMSASVRAFLFIQGTSHLACAGQSKAARRFKACSMMCTARPAAITRRSISLRALVSGPTATATSLVAER